MENSPESPEREGSCVCRVWGDNAHIHIECYSKWLKASVKVVKGTRTSGGRVSTKRTWDTLLCVCLCWFTIDLAIYMIYTYIPSIRIHTNLSYVCMCVVWWVCWEDVAKWDGRNSFPPVMDRRSLKTDEWQLWHPEHVPYDFRIYISTPGSWNKFVECNNQFHEDIYNDKNTCFDDKPKTQSLNSRTWSIDWTMLLRETDIMPLKGAGHARFVTITGGGDLISFG